MGQVINLCFVNTGECEDQIGLNYSNYISCMSNAYGQYVFHQAARQENLKLVKHLHQKGKNAVTKLICCFPMKHEILGII